jgi:hypothetical protein
MQHRRVWSLSIAGVVILAIGRVAEFTAEVGGVARQAPVIAEEAGNGMFHAVVAGVLGNYVYNWMFGSPAPTFSNGLRFDAGQAETLRSTLGNTSWISNGPGSEAERILRSNTSVLDNYKAPLWMRKFNSSGFGEPTSDRPQ